MEIIWMVGLGILLILALMIITPVMVHCAKAFMVGFRNGYDSAWNENKDEKEND